MQSSLTRSSDWLEEMKMARIKDKAFFEAALTEVSTHDQEAEATGIKLEL